MRSRFPVAVAVAVGLSDREAGYGSCGYLCRFGYNSVVDFLKPFFSKILNSFSALWAGFNCRSFEIFSVEVTAENLEIFLKNVFVIFSKEFTQVAEATSLNVLLLLQQKILIFRKINKKKDRKNISKNLSKIRLNFFVKKIKFYSQNIIFDYGECPLSQKIIFVTQCWTRLQRQDEKSEELFKEKSLCLQVT